MLNPLLKEAGLIDEHNASDPMKGAIGLADTGAAIAFLAHGAEVVGGMGNGINFAAIAPHPPAPAPTIAAPTVSIPLQTPSFGNPFT